MNHAQRQQYRAAIREEANKAHESSGLCDGCKFWKRTDDPDPDWAFWCFHPLEAIRRGSREHEGWPKAADGDCWGFRPVVTLEDLPVWWPNRKGAS